MRKLFLFLFLCSTLAIPAGFKHLTCGFKLIKMHLDTPFRADWEVQNDINPYPILSQEFTYLNRGAQSYVFLSQDGQYVVKFFRFDRAKKKVDDLFSACKLAFTKARIETGVLYVHLNQTEKQLPQMHLKGPLGQNITLAPDAYRFVIQKKVSSFQDAILKAEPELVRKRLDSFLSLLRTRLKRGIRNSDPAVIRNFGFLGENAVEIDFGNYSERPTSQEKEFAQYTNRLRAWLKDNAAEWVEYLDDRIASHQ